MEGLKQCIQGHERQRHLKLDMRKPSRADGWAGWLLRYLSPLKLILATDAYYVFLLLHVASNKARLEYAVSNDGF